MNGNGQCFQLTPDSKGSYVNGTWTTLTSMNYSRLFFSSDLLTNGNVYVCGGEDGTGGDYAELYNPQAYTWSVIPGPSGVFFSDACSKMLPNGNVLQSDSQSSYYIYNTASNTLQYGGSCEDMNESCWVRLPNDNVLAMTGYSTTSEHYVPSLNAWYADGDSPVTLFDSAGELGANFVLPNGNVFQIGGTTNTAIYTPRATLTSAGSWVAGPAMVFGTNQLGAVDAPAAMMADGNVLLCIGPIDGNSPSYFYEYNYVSNNFTQVGAPGGGSTYNSSAPFGTSMLDLPDGSVLFVGGQNSSSLYVYKPSGTPLVAGQPSINSITENADGSYHLTGVGLAGISAGAAYGDDEQMDSDYPLVRMTNNVTGNVYYARTYGWSSTTIQNPNPVTTEFALPNLPSGTYSLVVVANGNPSAPTNFTYSQPAVPTGLPAVLPGPIVVSNNETGLVIFSAAEDAWLGTNYGTNSSRTIYARFSMEFDNLNGKTGSSSGGGYGGLHFFANQGATPHLIAGDAWVSTNWSVDPYPPLLQTDLNPVTPIVFHQWHTIVERVDYTPGGNSAVKVWLDPNFNLTEAAQPNAPITFSMDDTFDTIMLRTGNGTTSATFSNIVMAATSADAGFAVVPAVMSITNSGGNMSLSWTSTGTLQQAPAVTGPWTDSANQANPQVLNATNSATFYRLQQ
jgi:hypothetical protein